jgi:heat-inducible transcriptional repressor
MHTPKLSERAGRILAALVREYIETGQPVASLSLARRSGAGLSSATVRNVLAQLEEQGYVRQPHTSAGRVPTDLGYRYYVDLLLQHRRTGRPSAAVEAELRQGTGTALMDDMLAHVSHLLSRDSRQVGFALGPENEAAAFHHIDFVPLSNTTVLVIMVARGGQVTHKVVDIRERLDADVLQQAANYLNREFAGLTLAEVRAAVMERLRQEQTLYDMLMSRALRLAQSTFDRLPAENPLFIDGTSRLLDQVSEGSPAPPLATLQGLLKLVEEKHRLVRLLTEYLNSEGLTVLIGAEHQVPDLKDFSLVTSTYFDGRRTGRVGVIGPTRMPYSRSIAIVDSVAQAVSRVLRDSGWDEDDAESERVPES